MSMPATHINTTSTISALLVLGRRPWARLAHTPQPMSSSQNRFTVLTPVVDITERRDAPRAPRASPARAGRGRGNAMRAAGRGRPSGGSGSGGSGAASAVGRARGRPGGGRVGRRAGPTIVVSDVDACREAVSFLRSHPRIAVDCEGVQLSRTGRLTLVQVAAGDRVYVFDLCAEEGIAERFFGDGGLRALLEGRGTVKVVHDCRHDSDALWWQYRVKLGPVIDTQVAFSVLRSVRGMTAGLPVSLRTLLKKFAGVTEDELAVKGTVKDAMRDDDKFWLKRPLSDLALQYARFDVEHLLGVTLSLSKYINGATSQRDKRGWQRVMSESREYTAVFRDDEDGPRKAQLQYEEMARVARKERAESERAKMAEAHRAGDPMRNFSFARDSLRRAFVL